MALPGTLATRGVPLQRLLGGERVVVVGVGGEGAGFEARLTGREGLVVRDQLPGEEFVRVRFVAEGVRAAGESSRAEHFHSHPVDGGCDARTIDPSPPQRTNDLSVAAGAAAERRYRVGQLDAGDAALLGGDALAEAGLMRGDWVGTCNVPRRALVVVDSTAEERAAARRERAAAARRHAREERHALTAALRAAARESSALARARDGADSAAVRSGAAAAAVGKGNGAKGTASVAAKAAAGDGDAPAEAAASAVVAAEPGTPPHQRRFPRVKILGISLSLVVRIFAYSCCVGLYMVCGAFALRGLELDHEKQQIAELAETLRVWQADLAVFNATLSDAQRVQLEGLVQPLRENGACIFQDVIGGDVLADSPVNWNFLGSLWFVFTVITTIGYGTYTPATTGGQVFTTVFMYLFIPPTIFFISQLAQLLHAIFLAALSLLIIGRRAIDHWVAQACARLEERRRRQQEASWAQQIEAGAAAGNTDAGLASASADTSGGDGDRRQRRRRHKQLTSEARTIAFATAADVGRDAANAKVTVTHHTLFGDHLGFPVTLPEYVDDHDGAAAAERNGWTVVELPQLDPHERHFGFIPYTRGGSGAARVFTGENSSVLRQDTARLTARAVQVADAVQAAAVLSNEDDSGSGSEESSEEEVVASLDNRGYALRRVSHGSGGASGGDDGTPATCGARDQTGLGVLRRRGEMRAVESGMQRARSWLAAVQMALLPPSIDYSESQIKAARDSWRFRVLQILVYLSVYFAIILLFAMAVALDQDWDYWTAFYFASVTFTTVGFGNIVLNELTSGELIGYIIFIFIGLAALASLIGLVGEYLDHIRRARVAEHRLYVANQRTARQMRAAVLEARGVVQAARAKEEANEVERRRRWHAGLPPAVSIATRTSALRSQRALVRVASSRARQGVVSALDELWEGDLYADGNGGNGVEGGKDGTARSGERKW